jgi:spore coat polysaccharide biosynthesis protein SpsF
MTEKKFETEQEQFWAGEFGTDYIDRNKGDALLASNLNFFSHALRGVGKIGSCIEFGANIGMNLKALKLLHPELKLQGIEINEDAAAQLREVVGDDNVFCESIFEWEPQAQVELSLIKGVLIHINPDRLKDVYQAPYQASSRYVLVCEYYNPAPVTINYRGHENRLFKRDFAGEMMDIYADLKLIDYGFSYRRDPVFPQDDVTWFLMEKKG